MESYAESENRRFDVPTDSVSLYANRLKPIIDRVFPFEQVVEAFRYYENAKPLGKIVISHK